MYILRYAILKRIILTLNNLDIKSLDAHFGEQLSQHKSCFINLKNNRQL